MIYNVGFNRASATSAVEKNGADMVALGQAFIANPDLVERYRNGWTVNRPRVATYYSQGPDGYIDYPVHARSEEHTSELQSLMRISYAVFCLKKKNKINNINSRHVQKTTKKIKQNHT